MGCADRVLEPHRARSAWFYKAGRDFHSPIHRQVAQLLVLLRFGLLHLKQTSCFTRFFLICNLVAPMERFTHVQQHTIIPALGSSG